MSRPKKHKYYAKKVKVLENHPMTPSAVDPINLQEQKELFLRHGKTPKFVHNDLELLEDVTSNVRGQIRFDLLGEAEYILNTVHSFYGEGEHYLRKAYGERIGRVQATQIVTDYLKENMLTDALTLIWCDDLPCSARMVWVGPVVKCNRPEARNYSLWINGSMENPYMREQGVRSLMDHELGTHFFRMFNDGLQPWYSDRKRFGLRSMKSFECLCIEEGLAAINTALRSNIQYLWLTALVYYTACKSAEMTFRQLFDHLGRYISNREQRWKHVMRVKRGLPDPNDLGGYGKDQCYFEGAVKILRSIDDIDFQILMSGKICLDEISRVKRLVRMNGARLPSFMKDMPAYKQQLRQMAILNGVFLSHPKRLPPMIYIKRMKERKNRVGVTGSASKTGRKTCRGCFPFSYLFH